MITAIMGILAGKPVLSSGPTLSQTLNVKFDFSGAPTISGWNMWYDTFGTLVLPLNNTSGSASGINIENISGYFDGPAVYSSTIGDLDFPDAVINRLLFTVPNVSKQMKLTGVDNAKRYTIMLCAFAEDADFNDNTDYIVQGVTKYAPIDVPNQIYKTIFSDIAPIWGEISITVQGSPIDGRYGCVNGLIIKEYIQ